MSREAGIQQSAANDRDRCNAGISIAKFMADGRAFGNDELHKRVERSLSRDARRFQGEYGIS